MKSAIIVLKAVINHAHRYAALARKMAEKESDSAAKERLLKISEVCEYVPENPARNFHEALQSMAFCNLAKLLKTQFKTTATGDVLTNTFIHSLLTT